MSQAYPTIDDWEMFSHAFEQFADVVTQLHSVESRQLEHGQAVDTCADYLLNRWSYLCYDVFLELGFPIATGVIEGACRHLVKDRMDLTGARWRLQRAEAVLKLRSLRSSGDFEAYWCFHKEQELHRNHLSRYADSLFLDVE